MQKLRILHMCGGTMVEEVLEAERFSINMHPSGRTIVQLKDATGRVFATSGFRRVHTWERMYLVDTPTPGC
jgi:hypothetical protein